MQLIGMLKMIDGIQEADETAEEGEMWCVRHSTG